MGCYEAIKMEVMYIFRERFIKNIIFSYSNTKYNPKTRMITIFPRIFFQQTLNSTYPDFGYVASIIDLLENHECSCHNYGEYLYICRSQSVKTVYVDIR